MQLRISKCYLSLVPTNMLFDRSKEFFVETDVRDGQRNGIRAMDIGGGCDSKNSVLLSRRHYALKKIADEPQILPKTLHFFILCIFFSAASSRCPQMQEIRCFCKIGCFQATNFFFPLVRTTGRLICGRRAYIVSLGCMRRSCNKDSLHTAHVISIMQDIQINLPAACIHYTRFGCPKSIHTN